MEPSGRVKFKSSKKAKFMLVSGNKDYRSSYGSVKLLRFILDSAAAYLMVPAKSNSI